jgi:hypothetical protein
LEEFKVASLEFLFDSGLEDDAKFFIEEEANYSKPEPLDEFAEPPRPPIELKPLPTGLRYAFLDDDLESHVIIRANSVFNGYLRETSLSLWLLTPRS